MALTFVDQKPPRPNGTDDAPFEGGKEKGGVGQRKRSSLRRGRHYVPLGLVYDTACKYARKKSILRHTWDRLLEAIRGEDGEKGCCRMLLFGGAALVFPCHCQNVVVLGLCTYDSLYLIVYLFVAKLRHLASM